jgi:hypothetical protein
MEKTFRLRFLISSPPSIFHPLRRPQSQILIFWVSTPPPLPPLPPTIPPQPLQLFSGIITVITVIIRARSLNIAF